MNDKTIVFKHHTNDLGEVLAAADAELIGKTLKEGKITFIVSKTFYSGEEITEDELGVQLLEAGNINLVGEKCVNTAMRKGILGEKNIIRIQGVPHAQVYKLNSTGGY
ncbi:MAG: DUF424 family protein [archaeon]